MLAAKEKEKEPERKSENVIKLQVGPKVTLY